MHYIPHLRELIVEVLAPVPSSLSSSSLPPPPPRLTMATKCFGRRGLRVEPSPMIHGHLTPVDVENIIRSFAKSPGPVGFRERPPLRSGSMKSIGFKPRWLRYAAVVQAQDVRLTCCWVIIGTSPATILETQSAISTICHANRGPLFCYTWKCSTKANMIHRQIMIHYPGAFGLIRAVMGRLYYSTI